MSTSTPIEIALASVTDATVRLEDAEAVLAAAKNNQDAVATRIAALEDEIAAIAAKRRAGKGDDNADAGRLLVIDMDLADLHTMRADADEAAAQHQRAADAARTALASAQRHLEHEKQEEILHRLKARADELAAQLFSAVSEIDGPHKTRHRVSTNLWSPPPGLADLLYRLKLTDGLIARRAV